MSRHVARLLVFALLLVALLAPIGRLAAVGPIVTPGTIPTAQIKGVVKFRNFAPLATGFDVQIGPSEAVSANNGGDANYPWGAVNAVSFAYNGNQLAAGFPTLNGGSPNTVTYPGALSGPLNYLQIDVVCRDPGATVALKNVMVAGTSLGDFMPATCGGAGDTHSWYVTGLDLSAGFQDAGLVAGQVDDAGAGHRGQQDTARAGTGHRVLDAGGLTISAAPVAGDHGFHDLAQAQVLGRLVVGVLSADSAEERLALGQRAVRDVVAAAAARPCGCLVHGHLGLFVEGDEVADLVEHAVASVEESGFVGVQIAALGVCPVVECLHLLELLVIGSPQGARCFAVE